MRSEKKVAYCILHYQNIDMTIDCVESIIDSNRDNHFYQVVLVDNGSPNKSGAVLKDRYKDIDEVTVICNEENLGFAKGNNVGYKYAREELHSELIVIMNSDMIVNEDFCADRIYKEASHYSCEIIAPDIINKQGYHQNPLLIKPYPISTYLMSVVKNSIWYTGVSCPIIGQRVYELYSKKNNDNSRYKDNVQIFDENTFVPHGSCLIFTNDWIRKEDNAFLPITFLYNEEEILYAYVHAKGYSIKYCPKLKLNHLEDGSLDYEYSVGKKKLRFLCVQQNKSIMKLLQTRLKAKLGTLC